MQRLQRQRQILQHRWVAAVAYAVTLLLAVATAAAEPIGYITNSTAPHGLVELDLATGALVPVGPFGIEGAWVRALAIAPDQTLYGIDELGRRLLRIDMESGAAEAVAPLAIADPWAFFTGMTFDSRGSLFATAALGTLPDPQWLLLSIDPTSGAVAELPLVGNVGDYFIGLAACGETLYTSTPDGLAVIDRGDGEVTPVSPDPTPPVQYLAFDATGELWGYSDPPPPPILPPPTTGYVFQIDRETGAVVQTATFPGSTHTGLAIAPPGPCPAGSPLPIPAASPLGLAVLILALAAGGLLVLGRRRSLRSRDLDSTGRARLYLPPP